MFRKMYLTDQVDFAPQHLKEEAKRIKSDFDDQVFGLGLYLAPEFRLLSGFTGGNHQQVDITPTGISEEVVRIKNIDALWDDYFRDRVPWPAQNSTGAVLQRDPMFESKGDERAAATKNSAGPSRKSRTPDPFETAFDTYKGPASSWIRWVRHCF